LRKTTSSRSIHCERRSSPSDAGGSGSDLFGIEGTDLEDYTAAWERVAGPYLTVGRDPEKMFALDRFICEDVLVNTIYGENQRVLGEMLESVGDTAGASTMRTRAAHTTEGLVSKCYDAEAGPSSTAGRREERLR
jgi:hypothetical protein